MLWACLLLPSLPLDVFARAQTPADAVRPFAVTTGGHYPRVVIANATANAAGVRSGQLVSASLVLAPDLVMRDRDPQAEAKALAAVAGWATQFTPAVSLAAPDGVLAEIGGSLRLFGGLPQMTTQFTRGAHDLGYTARLAVAPTPTAALLFARTATQGTEHIFRAATQDAEHIRTATRGTEPIGRAAATRGTERICRAAAAMPRREQRQKCLSLLQSALAPLPLAKLDAAPETVALLAAAGITTFGQACKLPRDALTRRIGGAFVASLDRARGLAPDPRVPFVPLPHYEGKLELPATIEHVEALVFAVNRLVQELAGWLSGRGLGVVRMSLALVHERYAGVRTGIPATVVHFGLAAPARDPAHLVGVLRERLAQVALPAPVIALVLESGETARLAGRNLGLLPGDEAPAAVPLLDRLRARLGEEAVMRVMPHHEHRPELAWRTAQTLEFGNARRATKKTHKTRSVVESAIDSPSHADPRPVWLLSEAEPIGPALESQPWVLRDGPERIESGWWDGVDVRRDYFVAESPRGEMMWIYRDHRYGIDAGEWFLHGLFA